MTRLVSRWALALALGLRQGEALGLTWDDVNLDKGTIRIRRSRLRPRYAHGCGGACGKTPGRCPQRQATRPATGAVKSKAGRRAIGLPPQLIALLRTHQAEQQHERATARQLWHDEGWVFATPIGQPINPRTDYTEWKRLLKEAGLREGRLHDARHTAATVLLVLRQPTPTVMSLIGWPSGSMAARYQHVTDVIPSQWRWRWDLNPRRGCPLTRFRGVRPRPLGDSTAGELTRTGACSAARPSGRAAVARRRSHAARLRTPPRARRR